MQAFKKPWLPQHKQVISFQITTLQVAACLKDFQAISVRRSVHKCLITVKTYPLVMGRNRGRWF